MRCSSLAPPTQRDVVNCPHGAGVTLQNHLGVRVTIDNHQIATAGADRKEALIVPNIEGRDPAGVGSCVVKLRPEAGKAERCIQKRIQNYTYNKVKVVQGRMKPLSNEHHFCMFSIECLNES